MHCISQSQEIDLFSCYAFCSVIRQQLTNTEDIRRIRKKAPCTGPEILMIQMQFLEDDIFNEPIFTGELLCQSLSESGLPPSSVIEVI